MEFKDIKQALAFYRYKNPARQRSYNMLERETSTRRNVEVQFSGLHHADIWASIVASIEWAKSHLDYEAQQIVNDCYLKKDLLHPIEASEKYFKSERTIYTILKKFNSEFDRDLKRRGLLCYRE